MDLKENNFKVKLFSASGSLSGGLGFLGGWQVCHNLCLGLIALLSVIGITVVGMPLLFLTKVAVPLWTAAVVLLGITAAFYFKKKCISKNALLFNTGIIVAGTPFSAAQRFAPGLWSVGGLFVLAAVVFFIKGKIEMKKVKL